jgi:hypothetical protein
VAPNHSIHVEQGELTLTRYADSNAVPIEMIRAKKNSGSAFTLACDSSGLDDKEIYMSLNIDAGTFSRIKKGTNTLNPDQMNSFCKVVGNTIYPEWLAYQVGCTLVMIQSEAERLAAEAQASLEMEREKNKLLMQLLQGKAA